MRLTTTAGLTVVAAALVVGIMVAVAGAGATTGSLGPEIAMVDGRGADGTVEVADVPLRAADDPQGEVVAAVPDGTPVRILGEEGGPWVQVATLDDASVGWIDAGRLRDTAHVVGEPASCPTALYAGPTEAALVLAELHASEEVVLVDEHVGEDGGAWIGVHSAAGDAIGMVPVERLQPTAGPASDVGMACDVIVPDEGAVPHRH